MELEGCKLGVHNYILDVLKGWVCKFCGKKKE